jgi:superfamily II DNA or RNA helicase
MENKKFVSDTITSDVVKQLSKGKNYLIGSEMNSGKNFWARNVLLPFAFENNKRTLFLSHRKQTINQQSNYLEEYKQDCIRQFKGGLFEIRSYQAFQKMIHRNDPMINGYDYIVCDEAHYFVNDSSFNMSTELSFNFLNENTDSIKIFMTATSDGLDYLPWKKTLISLKEANFYNNSIKDLYRYEENETALAVISNEIKKGKKVLAFHNSIQTTSDFNIGNSQTLFAGNQDESSEFLQIAKHQKFECDVLNTTKLMTEATEIKDELVETIIINGISDIDTFPATG